MWRAAANLVFLTAAGWFDLRTRKIPVRLILAALAAAVAADLMLCLQDPSCLTDCLFSLLPGVFLLLLAFVTRGQIGCGDGLCLLISGLLTGSEKTCFELMTAAVLSAVYAAFLLIRKKRSADPIAFVPFLAAGAAAAIVFDAAKEGLFR